MQHGDFIWCDLSAHRAAQSRAFYTRVFGWDFSGSGDYNMAQSPQGQMVAGHYQMPQKFIDIRMPAFWMSYIAVDDVAQIAQQEAALGAKVELGPAEFSGGGTYALIRDPLGAGFTVYNGPELGKISNAADARMGHGLFVSDASAVIGFYQSLFGWVFSEPADGVYPASTKSGYTFYLHEIPDLAIRGKEEFWAVYFATPSLHECSARVQANGGLIAAQMPLPEGAATLMRDPDNGVFIVVEQGAGQSRDPKKPFLWKAWAGLGLTIALIFTPLIWPWAIFLPHGRRRGCQRARDIYLNGSHANKAHYYTGC